MQVSPDEERLVELLSDVDALLCQNGFVDFEAGNGTGATIHLHGESFEILPGPGPGRFVIFHELSEADDDQARPEVLRKMLELNFSLAVGGRGGITVEPGTNRIALVVPGCTTAPASTLLDALRAISAQAAHWRETGFRNGPISHPPLDFTVQRFERC
jgi:hypothetical protein